MQENGAKKDTKFKPGNKAGSGRPKGSENKSTKIKNVVDGIMSKIAAGELTVQNWDDIEKYVYTVLAYDGLSDKNPKVRLKVAMFLLPFMKATKNSGELGDATAKGLQINLFAPHVPDDKKLENAKQLTPVIINPVKEVKSEK